MLNYWSQPASAASALEMHCKLYKAFQVQPRSHEVGVDKFKAVLLPIYTISFSIRWWAIIKDMTKMASQAAQRTSVRGIKMIDMSCLDLNIVSDWFIVGWPACSTIEFCLGSENKRVSSNIPEKHIVNTI